MESSLYDEFKFLEDYEGNENSANLLDWCKTHGERGELLLEEWDYEHNVEFGIVRDVMDFTYGASNKVWWKCSECGRVFQMRIAARTIHRQGCSICGHKRGGVKNHRNAIKNGNDLYSWCQCHGELGKQLIEEWDKERNIQDFGVTMCDVSYGNGTKVHWKCKRCGNSFDATVTHRTLYKVSCTRCSRRGTSYPEQFIYHALKQLYPDTENRAKLFGNYEYDIYIPDINTCVEYDGKCWHQWNPHRDALKEKICIDNGYRFIRVVAYDKKRSLTVNGNLIEYTVDLCHQDEQLIQIVDIILGIIEKKGVVIDYEAVKDGAYQMMKGEKKDNFTTEYGALLDEWDYDNNRGINPKCFTKGSHQRINWKCARCGHGWSNTIHSRCGFKSGCPSCGYNVFDGKVHCQVAKLKTCRFGQYSL